MRWAFLVLLVACERAPVVEAISEPAAPDAEVAAAVVRADARAGVIPKERAWAIDDLGRRPAAVAALEPEPADASEPYAVRPGEVPTYVIEGTASDAPAPASAPPVEAVPTAPTRGPLLLADARGGRIEVLARDAKPLGRLSVPGADIRGISHDRRDGDGVWILVGGSPPRVAKLGWDGRTLRSFPLTRPPLRRARKLLGLDHVMGHARASDLVLVLYENVLGVPVIEGIRVEDANTRFVIGSSREANLSGIRADGLRHDAVDGLLVLDWWTVRARTHLERWRFFHGFVDKTDERTLAAPLSAFDIPPWREVWGVEPSERRVLRMGGDGAVVQTMPAGELTPSGVAISN